MPRKGHTQKRDVLADPLYNNKVVTKLINNIMLDGKKGVAQKIVYKAFARVEEKAERPALEVFEEAMNNVMPVLEEINYMGPLTLEILYPPISMLESFVKQSYECLSYLIDQAVGGAAKTQV